MTTPPGRARDEGPVERVQPKATGRAEAEADGSRLCRSRRATNTAPDVP